MAKLSGDQLCILREINSKCRNEGNFVADTIIAYLTRIPLQDARDLIATLQDESLIEVVRTEGLQASITPVGRLRLKTENAFLPGVDDASISTHSRSLISTDDDLSIGTAIYFRRSEVTSWTRYNHGTKRRFWVCGTSLMQVAEYEEKTMIPKFFDRNVYDVRILVSGTAIGSPSRLQLEGYDRRNKGPLLPQVDLAERSFKSLEKQVTKALRSHRQALKKSGKSTQMANYLRQHSNIMYSNITLYDNDAFIAFYNSTGVGADNLTLHFTVDENIKGYNRAESEFMLMWDESR